MARNKSNKWMFLSVLLLIIVVGGLGYFLTRPAQQTVFQNSDSASGSCLGLSSVNVLYNDFDHYKAGTDPASHITIYEENGQEFKLALADDVSSGHAVTSKASFKGVVGTNAGTPKSGYFSELVEFDTNCNDVPVQTEMKPSGTPTITLLNDDAVTKNTDTNHESMGASSTYQPSLTIKAPAEACASRHGAYLIADYDATYFNKLTTSDLVDGNTLVLFTHNYTGNVNAGTSDQFKVWEYSGELCNGDKKEVQVTIETTATQPTEDVNIDFWWLSKDIDVDADSYRPLSPAIYDEDNNNIYDVITNVTYYTA